MRTKFFAIVALVLTAILTAPSIFAADQPVVAINPIAAVNVQSDTAQVAGLMVPLAGAWTFFADAQFAIGTDPAHLAPVGTSGQVMLQGEDTNGAVPFAYSASGLTPGTRYYYQLTVTPQPGSIKVNGVVQTAPPVTQLGSFMTPAIGAPVIGSTLAILNGKDYQVPAVLIPGASAYGVVGGSIGTVYVNLSSKVMQATSLNQTELGGISVTVDETLVPLLGVSPTQVTFLVPQTKAASIAVAVKNQAGPSAEAIVPIVANNPVILGTFDANWNALTYSWIQFIVGYKPVSLVGEEMIIAATGIGTNAGFLEKPAAASEVRAVVRPNTIMVTLDDGTVADVTFIGAMPGTLGITQVNVTWPKVITGIHNATLSVAGTTTSFVIVGN
jgi:uncharacterized protein (TIGR03437 family)